MNIARPLWRKIVVVTMNLFSRQHWIPMSLVSEGTSSSSEISMSLSSCVASANDPLLLGASMFSSVWYKNKNYFTLAAQWKLTVRLQRISFCHFHSMRFSIVALLLLETAVGDVNVKMLGIASAFNLFLFFSPISCSMKSYLKLSLSKCLLQT